jgi:glycoside/pentoside/hexuronide:cation symporter, GPH family
VCELTSTPPTRLALAAFAAPCFSLAALYLPLNVYLPEFYANAIGLKLGAVGLIFMTVRLVDIAFDPFIGGIMDRTRTRWGRFRPWLAIAAPLILFGVSRLFMAHRGVGVVYLTTWLAVVFAGFSIGTLAQLSLGAGLSERYQERARVFAWWHGANALAITIAMLIPIVFSRLEPGIELVPIMAWWVIAVTLPAFAWPVLAIRERTVQTQRSRNGARDYFLLLRRRSVRLILLADLMMGLGAGIGASVGIFFMTFSKHLDKSALGVMLICLLVVGTLTTPFWTYATRKLEKHRAWALAALINALAIVLALMAPKGGFVFLCVSYAIAGLAFGGNYILPRAMMADAGDEELLESGVDQTGLLYAWVTSVFKIGQAAAVGIVFLGLEFVHFNPAKGADNDSLSLGMLPVFYGVVPAALCLISAVVIWWYPLTSSRHAEIRAQLADMASRGAPDHGRVEGEGEEVIV